MGFLVRVCPSCRVLCAVCNAVTGHLADTSYLFIILRAALRVACHCCLHLLRDGRLQGKPQRKLSSGEAEGRPEAGWWDCNTVPTLLSTICLVHLLHDAVFATGFLGEEKPQVSS